MRSMIFQKGRDPTTADGANAAQVTAVAKDLPGHTGQKTLQM